jgi:hypothetical protein
MSKKEQQPAALEIQKQLPLMGGAKFLTTTVYFGPSKMDLVKRYMALEKVTNGTVSMSGLITTAMEVCIDTFEKEIPVKRKFEINGRIIVV